MINISIIILIKFMELVWVVRVGNRLHRDVSAAPCI